MVGRSFAGFRAWAKLNNVDVDMGVPVAMLASTTFYRQTSPRGRVFNTGAWRLGKIVAMGFHVDLA